MSQSLEVEHPSQCTLPHDQDEHRMLSLSVPTATLQESTEHRTPNGIQCWRRGVILRLLCQANELALLSREHCLGLPEVKACICQTRIGACWNWNIITTKQDYLEQRFQMGLEMTLLLRHNRPQQQQWEKHQARHTFWGMMLAFRAPGQHSHPPFLAGKY